MPLFSGELIIYTGYDIPRADGIMQFLFRTKFRVFQICPVQLTLYDSYTAVITVQVQPNDGTWGTATADASPFSSY